MARWMIEVIDKDGNRMHLRRGAKPGSGPIVKHTSRKHAEINIEMMRPGLDDIQSINVVPYDASEE